MFRQQNGSVDPMEVPINRSVLGDKKTDIKKKKKKIRPGPIFKKMRSITQPTTTKMLLSSHQNHLSERERSSNKLVL